MDKNLTANSVAEEDVATMLPTVGLDGEPLEDSSIEHEEDTAEVKKKIFEDADVEEVPEEMVEAFMELMELDDYQEIIQESSFDEEEDIFYNKAKYENGEINLLFITGYSGSGKSTMSEGEKKILREVVDMDRIILFTNKNDDYYIAMGPFAKEFMINGPGKKYREPETKETLVKNASDQFRKEISRDIVKFAKKYAKEHKTKKLVMEGVWVYRYVEPAEIDDCAVYIKGTSLKTSTKRAIERDHKNFEKEGKGNIVRKSAHAIMKSFMASRDLLLRPLERYQKYFGELYRKQKNEAIKYNQKIKNTTKGVIHDFAAKIKNLTESEDILMGDIEFSEAMTEYMTNPDILYDTLVEEGVSDLVGKLKERVVVSQKTCQLVVDIYMLKKKIKRCNKKEDTKCEIDLKRELVQKQKQLAEVKRTASPELQKEISKIEKTLEKNTAKFNVDDDVKIESSDDLVTEAENAVKIDRETYTKIRKEEIEYMKKFQSVLHDYTDSQKSLNTAIKKRNTSEISGCVKDAIQKLNALESTVKSAPKMTGETASVCANAIKVGITAITAKLVHDNIIMPTVYKATTAKLNKDHDDYYKKMMASDHPDYDAISKDREEHMKKHKKICDTSYGVDTALIGVGAGLLYANAKNKEIKFKDHSAKFKEDQLKFIEKNRQHLEKIATKDFSVKKESDEILNEGDEIMESLHEIEVYLENELFIEKEEDKDLPPELKRLDELRGQIENLTDDLNVAKDKFEKTGEKLYENKIKGITSKIEKLKKELSDKEKEAEKIQNDSINEATEIKHPVPLDSRINYWQQMVDENKAKLKQKEELLKRTTLAGDRRLLSTEIAKLIQTIKKYTYTLTELQEQKKNIALRPTLASADDLVDGDEFIESVNIDLDDELMTEGRFSQTIDDRINYWVQMIDATKKRIADLENKYNQVDSNIAKDKINNDILLYKGKLRAHELSLEKVQKQKEAMKECVDDSIIDQVLSEAANMEDEIKSIVNTLNSKGYHVKYASPGHTQLRKKEDAEPDGVYYGKLYSDARVMFDKKYSFPNAPKYWHWRDVEGCSYLDITPISYDKNDGTADAAFKKWKSEYMDSLRSFVNDLKDNSDKDVKESVDDFANSFLEEMYERMGFNDLEDNALYVNESVNETNQTAENLLKDLDNLLS